MKKSDLKDRMVVKIENGNLYFVVGNTLIGSNGYDLLSNYDDNLCNPHYPDLDIICVYDCIYKLSPMFLAKEYVDKCGYLKLLWQRGETKEITISDIEEKFGCKVKIVNG